MRNNARGWAGPRCGLRRRAEGSAWRGHPPRDSSSPLLGSESGDSGHVMGTTYPAAPEWQLERPMRGLGLGAEPMRARLWGAGRTAVAAAGGGGGGGELGRRRPGLAWPGLACQGAGDRGSSTMSLQYGAEETPLAGSYGAADSFPKDFGYGVEEEEEEAAAAGGGVGAGAGGGCGPGGADSSKPRILLMGLRRSGKSSIQKVSGAAPRPPALSGGSGGRGVGEAPEEGGGHGWRAGLSHRAFSSPLGSRARGAAGARTPTSKSTPKSAEAKWVPEGETGWREAGARGTARDLRLLGPSPVPFTKPRPTPQF